MGGKRNRLVVIDGLIAFEKGCVYVGEYLLV